MKDIIARRIVIKGLVQGIGYRPFVAESAEKYQITGWVRNTAGIVTIMAVGQADRMEQFLSVLSETKPAGAWVHEIEIMEVSPEETDVSSYKTFIIEASEVESIRKATPYIPPDLPTCDICKKQLADRNDRRYRYPFISCTSCGPRYSIIEKLPYDRDTITMRDFEMCEECAGEYYRKGDIRRHAQTIACHKCGPGLSYISVGSDLSEKKEEAALQAAEDCLKKGGIVAIKDIGGFHLACSPYNAKAVEGLRLIKGREKKPFAVMFPDVAAVKEHCQLDKQEEEQLLSAPRPIVLLRKGNACDFAENVCTNSPDIGAMLPCNPLQILLTGELGALVMTSANRSGELMMIENKQMLDWMCQCEDVDVPLGILQHDRRILTPLDDSIVRMVAGFRQVFRRARGMVPAPIELPGVKQSAPRVFAAGGDLKSSFCYTSQKDAYVSQHLGDLEDEPSYLQYQKEIQRMQELFDFQPEREVCDRHPAYLSAKPKNQLPVFRIQHHHAHAASVIAEHGLKGNVLCVTFDGTGYGLDQTVWGSEFFLWDEKEMKRAAHLKPVTLIGGNEGARNADAILYGYLASFETDLKEISGQNENAYRIVETAIRQRINCITSSSMGRLFDAVSALLDICHYNGYEGEAPIELEYLAAKAKRAYPLQITLCQGEGNKEYLGDTKTLFEGLFAGMKTGVPREELALGFIYAVAGFVFDTCQRLKDIAYNPGEAKQVALSGGTFQNRILLEQTVKLLKEEGFCVYINEQVSSGDGGICLGQAYLGMLAE